MLEELHWLLLMSGHVLADCGDGETPLVSLYTHRYYNNTYLLVHAATSLLELYYCNNFSKDSNLKKYVSLHFAFCVKESPHRILVTKILDILLQVPESISALNVSTTDAANHPAVLLSRLVSLSIVHVLAHEILSASF